MNRLPRAEGLAEDLVGAIGDHLIGVGVRRRPRAGLENIDDEIPVEFAFLDFLGRYGCFLVRAREQKRRVRQFLTVNVRRVLMGITDSYTAPGVEPFPCVASCPLRGARTMNSAPFWR